MLTWACTSMNTRHQPEASLPWVSSFHVKILQGQEPTCPVCHTQNHHCCLPSLASPAVRNQLFPASPFHSRRMWHSCRDCGSSHTSIQYGDLMSWHQILKMPPPPYIAALLCFPWIATQRPRNTELQLEQPLQTTSLSQLTKPNCSSTYNSQRAEFLFQIALATY